MENEIASLQFEIKKINVEIKSLEKRLEQKRKSRLLDPEEEEELLEQIGERKSLASKLEGDIRKIENAAVRGSNVSSQGIELD